MITDIISDDTIIWNSAPEGTRHATLMTTRAKRKTDPMITDLEDLVTAVKEFTEDHTRLSNRLLDMHRANNAMAGDIGDLIKENQLLKEENDDLLKRLVEVRKELAHVRSFGEDPTEPITQVFGRAT